MKKKQLTISVVILTRDRPQLLKKALCSIQHQTIKPLEIVIVDDCSRFRRQTREVIQTHTQMPLVIKRNTYHTISYGRSAGAASAHGDIIVYLDDDCEATSTYLAQFRNHFQKSSHLTAVMGRIKNALPDNIFASTQFAYYDRGLRQFFPHLDKPELLTNGRILDCEVMGIRKTTLIAFGFPDQHEPHRNDDVDLGVRLVRAGRRVLFDPDIVAWSHPRDTCVSLWDAAFWNGYSDAYISHRNGINVREAPYPSRYTAWLMRYVRAKTDFGLWKKCIYALLLLSFPTMSRIGKAWYYLRSIV